MNTTDKKEFSHVLKKLFMAYGVSLESDLVDLWWNAMNDLTVEAFRSAASAHVRTSRYRPTPADVRELAGANKSAWPGPEESWNLLPKSEYEGGWMCQEMATALAVCMDSLDAGDRIAARMAFIECYKREIQGKQGNPKWWLSEPVGMTWDQRRQWENSMLEHHPGRRPDLLTTGRQMIEGPEPERNNCGLRRLSRD